MSGICGWFGTDLSTDQYAQTIQEMAAHLHLDRPKLNAHASHQRHAMAATGEPNALSLFDEDGLTVACFGDPWMDNHNLDRQREASPAAECIASLYREHGLDALQKLHGTFSIAIHDQNNNQTLIAIDRAGTVPLAYQLTQGGLVYGSTASSVAQHPAVNREIDPQGIFNYLYFHMVPSPGSIFKDQHKLLPAQYGLFSGGTWKTGFYWHMDYADEYRTSVDELQEEFDSVLRESVRDAARNQNVGAFLSGGTDSSTVSGILTEVLGQPAETYSIGFNVEGFDETEFARITSKHFGTRHHEYYVTPEDVVDAIPKISAAYDEPFGNASAVPTYFCAHRAREDGIDVLLAGDGGDELFGGNTRYATQKIFELYQNIPAIFRKGLLEPLSALPGVSAIPPARKVQSYIRQAKVPLPDRLETYNFLHQTAPSEIFTRDFLNSINENQPIDLIREVYHRSTSRSHINRMMNMDLKNTLADNDFRKVVRMCELGGIQVRFPLIDECMMNFAATIPPSLQVKGYKLRYFFKAALKDFLPNEVINKSKHGFGLPFGKWLVEHKPLQQLAEASLESFEKRGYVSPEYMQKLKTLHQGEHASYYGVMIWVMMMLEQWLQTHEA